MAEILDGAASPAQIAAFIVALRMKGETVAELVGMVDAMLDASTPVAIDLDGPVIDIVGTGGDRAHTINVSTLAALVVAGAGGQVCKHGNRAASSACGAADLLEALGVAIELGPDGVAGCVREAGIGLLLRPPLPPGHAPRRPVPPRPRHPHRVQHPRPAVQPGAGPALADRRGRPAHGRAHGGGAARPTAPSGR